MAVRPLGPGRDGMYVSWHGNTLVLIIPQNKAHPAYPPASPRRWWDRKVVVIVQEGKKLPPLFFSLSFQIWNSLVLLHWSDGFILMGTWLSETHEGDALLRTASMEGEDWGGQGHTRSLCSGTRWWSSPPDCSGTRVNVRLGFSPEENTHILEASRETATLRIKDKFHLNNYKFILVSEPQIITFQKRRDTLFSPTLTSG